MSETGTAFTAAALQTSRLNLEKALLETTSYRPAFHDFRAAQQELEAALRAETELLKTAIGAEGPGGMPAACTRGRFQDRASALSLSQDRVQQARAAREEASMQWDALYEKLKLDLAEKEAVFDKTYAKGLQHLAEKEAALARLALVVHERIRTRV